VLKKLAGSRFTIMEKFEYKVLYNKCELLRGWIWYEGRRALGQDISSVLNTYGAAGWELVSTLDAKRHGQTVFLKRRS
jgi:Domain of unknown function (DUF4177)